VAHQLTEHVTKVNGITTHDPTYTYNNDGDRIGASDSVTGTSTSYGYDQNDELTSYSQGSTSTTYAYNGDGLRMSTTVNGSASEGFVWDEAEGLPVIIGDGSTQYITGPGASPRKARVSSSSICTRHMSGDGRWAMRNSRGMAGRVIEVVFVAC
jgi:YD repeat-containing protein